MNPHYKTGKIFSIELEISYFPHNTQHYVRLLRETFDKHPTAEYMIILEEDLDVAVDIMDYFSQLIPVMDKDPSVYCISAWNDQVIIYI